MNETVETMPTPSCPVCGEQVVAKRNVVRAGNVAICTQCGTWHRVPRPSEQELKSIYDKNYYDAWGINEDENVTMLSKQATFLPLFKRIEAKLPDTGDLPVILDVPDCFWILPRIKTGIAMLLRSIPTQLKYFEINSAMQKYAAKILPNAFSRNIHLILLR